VPRAHAPKKNSLKNSGTEMNFSKSQFINEKDSEMPASWLNIKGDI